MCGSLDDMKALMKVNNICVMKQQFGTGNLYFYFIA